MIYGDSNTRKTSNCGRFASYIHRVTGRACRYISAESGGQIVIQPAVDKGLVLPPIWLHSQMNPRSALRKIARGEWLVPVDATGTRTADPAKAVGVRWSVTSPEEWARIGGYIFDGVSSVGALELADLRTKHAKVGSTSETGLAGPGYLGDGETLGASSKGQYGAAQQDILFLLDEPPKTLFDVSKGNVVQVLYTAHEAKGIDETTGRTIYGIDVPGQAIMSKIPRKVGTLIHTVGVLEKRKERKPNGQVVEVEVPAVYGYFQNHRDQQNAAIIWTAKARLPAAPASGPAMMKALEEKWPGGRLEFDWHQGIDDFLRFQEELRVSSQIN